MCGISGIYGIQDPQQAGSLAEAMNECLAHRGPDDKGIHAEPGIALAQRRLAIIDLSPSGHQPMFSADKRYCIVYNGELYNFKEVREKIKDYPFSTASDTEVILAAYAKWGKSCLEHFNGMFAFAIWDKEEQRLFIARDRLGIKPLYYYNKAEKLFFASELRALLASGIVPRKLNRDSLADFLRFQTVHAPATIVQDVHMLMPGHYMIMDKEGMRDEIYWKPDPKAVDTAGKSYKEVCGDVNKLLSEAVERRLVSDVPFGAFLSGGIDSSTVVALMSRVSGTKVKTFFVNFSEKEFSEAKYAKMIAEKFGTEHHELLLSPKDFLEELPQALKAMDHPSGDGPNSYLVSKATKKAGITMALSGLGGDELFCGYDVFQRAVLLQRYEWVLKGPRFMRKAMGSTLKALKPGVASAKINALLRSQQTGFVPFYTLSRQVLLDAQAARLIGRDQLSPNAVESIAKELESTGDREHLLSRVSMAEMGTYMQNVLLRDTDQMSMAHALEVRVPFLDYKLVEYVLSLPDKFKMPLSPKKLLVDSMGDLLPKEIVNRPKMGFTFPWKIWLRNELRFFCEERISSLSERGIVDAKELKAMWDAFMKSDPSVTWSRIWYLIVLETWLRENRIEG